jgi:hypothetical protein
MSDQTPASSHAQSPAPPFSSDPWPSLLRIYNGSEPAADAPVASFTATQQHDLWQEIHYALDGVKALRVESRRVTTQLGALQQELDESRAQELLLHGTIHDLQTELRQAKDQLKTQPAQVPTPPLSSEHPDPEPFDGSTPSDISDFILQMKIKLHVNADRYPNPTSRLGYFISRLKSKALQQVKYGINPQGHFVFKDVDEIILILETAYGNVAPKATAGREILSLKQGKCSLQEFLPEWQKLAHDSGFDDAALISILKNALHFQLTERLSLDPTSFTVDSLPDFLTMVRNADAILRVLYQNYFLNSPVGRDARNSNTVPAIQLSKPLSAPVTTSDIEDAMDLSAVWTGSQGGKRRPRNDAERKARREYCFKNNLCLFCESPDHRINDCPTRPVKKTNVPSTETEN